MIFLADESVDKPIVDGLRNAGFKVDYVTEIIPGAQDEYVLELANKLNALLITTDKDFGELIFRMQKSSCGVILIRLSGLTSSRKTEIVLKAINNFLNDLKNSFTVITSVGIRIRKQNLVK